MPLDPARLCQPPQRALARRLPEGGRVEHAQAELPRPQAEQARSVAAPGPRRAAGQAKGRASLRSGMTAKQGPMRLYSPGRRKPSRNRARPLPTQRAPACAPRQRSAHRYAAAVARPICHSPPALAGAGRTGVCSCLPAHRRPSSSSHLWLFALHFPIWGLVSSSQAPHRSRLLRCGWLGALSAHHATHQTADSPAAGRSARLPCLATSPLRRK